MKILRRRRGPFMETLAMLLDAPTDAFASAIERHRLCSRTTTLVVIDFLGRLPARLRLSGCALEPVEENRWFGAGTFVVNLARDEDALWAGMAADGCLLLARAVRDNGAVVAAHLAYVGDDTGLFLYGASAPKPPPGAGNPVAVGDRAPAQITRAALVRPCKCRRVTPTMGSIASRARSAVSTSTTVASIAGCPACSLGSTPPCGA